LDETSRRNRYYPHRSSANADKIVAIIKNCLEEWRKKRASKSKAAATSAKKQPEVEVQVPPSDTASPDTYDFSRSQSRDPAEYTRTPRHQFPSENNHSRHPPSPLDSPLRPVFVSPRTAISTRSDYAGSQYAQYGPENNTSFLNGGSQFLPDIYLAQTALAFNPGNTIAIMPTSPYDHSFGALLNSDSVGQSVYSTTRVSTGPRVDNMTHYPRETEEEQIPGSAYNPSERIERMFGISPPWRERQ
jgi:hypothetical protein